VELIALASIAALGLGATFLRGLRALLVCSLSAGSLAAALGGAIGGAAPAPPSRLPVDDSKRADGAYVSSRACRSCHPGEHQTWRDSYHSKMTQAASPQTVLAPFDGRTLTWQGRSYRVFSRDGRFYGDLPRFGTQGEGDDRIVGEVVMTTGSHHLQAYWLPMPQGETEAQARGRAVFAQRCALCHGDDAVGGRAPELVGVRLLPDEIAERLHDGHDRRGAPDDTDGGTLAGEDRDALALWLERVQFDGRLLQFPWVWAIEAGVWLHEEDSFLQPPPPHEDAERPGDRWGYSCDECHSVRPRYAWRAEGSVARSSAVELGIACEACHGPAREHVRNQQNPLRRYRAHGDEDAPPDIVNPARLDKKRASYVCAQCHADVVRRDDGYLPFKPGDDFEKSVNVVRLLDAPHPRWLADAIEEEPTRLDDTFWNDGTIRIAGRDFNGLIESACHTDGELGCLSCHQMHSANPDAQLGEGMRDDDACLSCHEDKRDVEAHTHHPPSSSGSRCYNCHMPYTTYGLMKAIRAHRIDSPSVRNEVESGRPNACNLCHLDKTLRQTAQDLERWYAQPVPEDLPPEHEGVAASIVWLLTGDAVVRAIASWHLGWEPALVASGRGWQGPLLAWALDDPYVAVRFLAWRALGRHEGMAGFAFAVTGPTDERARDAAGAREAATPLARAFAGNSALLLDDAGAPRWEDYFALALLRDETEVRVAE
jgi:predicted CXXCH cytochrome family protein